MNRTTAFIALTMMACSAFSLCDAQTSAAPTASEEDVHSVAMHPGHTRYLRGEIVDHANPVYGKLSVFRVYDNIHRPIEVHTNAEFPGPVGSTYRIRGYVDQKPPVGKQFKEAQYIFQASQLTRWDPARNAPWEEPAASPASPGPSLDPVSVAPRKVGSTGVNPLFLALGCIVAGAGLALLLRPRSAGPRGEEAVFDVRSVQEPTIIGERTEIALHGGRAHVPMLALQVVRGIEGMDVFPIGAPSEPTEIKFGRSANCAILLDHPLVGNEHGKFVVDAGGRWYIFLNNNKNTTYLTRHSLTSSLTIGNFHPLEHGDVLYLKDAGRVVLELKVALETAVTAVGVTA